MLATAEPACAITVASAAPATPSLNTPIKIQSKTILSAAEIKRNINA